MTLNFDDVKIIVNCRKCGLPAPDVEPVCGGCGASRAAEIAVARRRFAEKVVGLYKATKAILRNPDAITRMVRAMRPADVRGLCKAAGKISRDGDAITRAMRPADVRGLCKAAGKISRDGDAITRAMRPADVRGLCKAAGEVVAQVARRSRTGKPMLNPDVEIIVECDKCGWRGPAADPLACGGCGASLAAAQVAIARARAAFARPQPAGPLSNGAKRPAVR